jgi:hypothetical protein
MKERYHIKFNSLQNNVFYVTMDDKAIHRFNQFPSGLCYYYTLSHKRGVTLVNTIAAKKAKYTNEYYSCTKVAQETQINVGKPSTTNYLWIIKNNLLSQCPVTHEDILAAENIFEPNLGSIIGKTI